MKVHELFETFNRYQVHDVTKLPGKVDSAEKLAEIIKANCGEMLSAYKKSGKVLLRGMHETVQAGMTGIRKDRLPIQMNDTMHFALHKLFIKAGLKATRKNSIFCTTEKNIADNWGSNVYVIFVKDGWNGTVFENVKTDYTFYHMSREIGPKLMTGHDKLAMKALQDLKPLAFNDSEALAKILSAKYEDILISGDSYVALKVGGPVLPKVLELLDLLPTNIRSK